jgi:signal transduction histidine kinase
VDIEYIHVTRYNQQIVMLINGLPVLDTAGQVIGYRGVARDITDRKKEDQKRMVLELELRQAQRLESIGTLAAGVAHEINSPAQFINDNLHFLKDSVKSLGHYTQDCRKVASENEDLTARQQAVNRFDLQYDTDFLLNEIPQAIAQSLEGIDQIRQIVSAMKDFSHMGQGERASAYLHDAIENAITISRNEWKSVAEVKLDFCENLPLVPCFIGEIKQVILNLIVNAAHSIEDAIQEHLLDKGKITIRTHHDDAFAYIDITDTGTGIPEKNHTRIFDHFFTTKEVGRGTGQGLAMAYQTITEKHGGKISFDTAINVGTTFHIKLPLT